MGRAPCCDKANVKKGPWSPEEDAKLKAYIEEHGTGGNWIALPQKIGLKRCGKSCRLRWLNYLRPNIKHGGFSEEEDNIICSLYISIGSRWSIIAAQLPGRTDNDIKNYWNTRLKKKLLGKQRKEQQARRAPCALKQEIKKENVKGGGSLMFGGNSTTHRVTSYWPPQQPLPISIPSPIQDSRTMNDQTSLKRLLIKLGGRFSDGNDETVIPPASATTNGLKSYVPIDHSSSTPNFYGISSYCKTDITSNSETMHSLGTDQSCSWQADQIQFINSGSSNMSLAADHNNHISNELEKIIYSSSNSQTQRVGSDFDCFYGGGMASDDQSCGTSCRECINWYDISPLIHPSLSSTNYEGRMSRECITTQTRYPGLQ